MSSQQPRPLLKRPQDGGAPRHAVSRGVHDNELKAMAAEGLSRGVIAARLGCGIVVVKVRMAVIGVEVVKQKFRENQAVIAGEYDAAILALLRGGLFRPEIARRLGCNETTLCYRIQTLKAGLRE